MVLLSWNVPSDEVFYPGKELDNIEMHDAAPRSFNRMIFFLFLACWTKSFKRELWWRLQWKNGRQIRWQVSHDFPRNVCNLSMLPRRELGTHGTAKCRSKNRSWTPLLVNNFIVKVLFLKWWVLNFYEPAGLRVYLVVDSIKVAETGASQPKNYGKTDSFNVFNLNQTKTVSQKNTEIKIKPE